MYHHLYIPVSFLEHLGYMGTTIIEEEDLGDSIGAVEDLIEAVEDSIEAVEDSIEVVEVEST